MSEDNVVYLDLVTKLDIPIGRIIEGAVTHKVASVVVLGYDEDGDFYFASSIADGPEVLWLLELAKKKLLEVGS